MLEPDGIRLLVPPESNLETISIVGREELVIDRVQVMDPQWLARIDEMEFGFLTPMANHDLFALLAIVAETSRSKVFEVDQDRPRLGLSVVPQMETVDLGASGINSA